MDKIAKIKKLADAMYYAAQYLTTDASRLHKAMDEYHKFIIHEYHEEEPVSEDLEKSAKEYVVKEAVKDINGNWTTNDILNAFKAGAQWQKLNDMGITNNTKGLVSNVLNSSDEPLDIYATEVAFMMLPANLTENYNMTNRNRISDAVRLGAKWKEQQFEKNRIKHCDSITKEQAELEQGFVDQHFDKYNRTPTFLDAIEYGIRLKEKEMQSTIELAEDHAMLAGMEKMKEEMMAKAIDVEVHVDAGGYPYIPQIELWDYDKDEPLAKEGDKYKVVLIKEGGL